MAHSTGLTVLDFAKTNKPRKRQEKSLWRSISAPYGNYRQDYFGRKDPSKFDFIQAFTDAVYSCATLIATKIASTDIRLYVETRAGQRQPKCGTRPVLKGTYHKLYQSRTKALDIRQVTEHPLLGLLTRLNPYHNRLDLIELTELYLEITGNAYWLLKFNELGIPGNIFLLPSQFVEPVRDDYGIIQSYRFLEGQKETILSTEEVIHFRFPSLKDPYGEGEPPLRAAWDIVQISSKQYGYLSSTLTNNARPDCILSPMSPEQPISGVEAERLAKDFNMKFSGAGSGGLFVTQDAMTLTPLGWSPKDLAGLEIAKAIKTSVCNAYHVPISIFEEQESNYASASVAKENLAINCLVPRMTRIVAKLNERLCPLFDDRLFFDYDDSIIPTDREYELNRLNSLSDRCIITREERREAEGYESATWAETPLIPAGVFPMPEGGISVPEQSDEMSAPVDAVQDSQDQSAPTDDAATALRATVGGSQQILAMQQAVVSGQVTVDMARANAMIIFGLSAQEANALFPDVQPKPAPEPAPVKSKAVRTLPVPDVRQSKTWDCGAAVTASIAKFFGFNLDEEELIQALGTNPEDGTRVTHIVNYLQSLNLNVQAQQHCSVDDLRAWVNKGMPVICPVQMYGTPEQEQQDKSGHYVIVTGVDETIHLQDPSSGPGQLDPDEFLSRWSDQDDQTEYIQFAIAVGKGEKRFKAKEKPPERMDHLPLMDALTKFFQRQAKSVIGQIKDTEPDTTKSLPDKDFFSVKDWTQDMVEEVGPVVRMYFEQGATQATADIGRTKEDVGKLPSGKKVPFTRRPNDTQKVMILADPAKLDKDWQPDTGYYIPPGGGGAEIPGRRDAFTRFLEKGDPVQASVVWLNKQNTLIFEDGRHRFSIMRDMGIDRVPLMVGADQVDKFVERYGAQVTDLLKVVQPNLEKGFEQSTFAFCEATNQTTALELSTAVTQLKETLTSGVSQGEVKQALRKRVQEIFTGAENARAFQIAVTEASRAQSQALIITAKKSGVAKKKKWIASSRACEECLALANKVVEIDKNFTVDNDNRPEYRDIKHPPLHPRCMCGLGLHVDNVTD